MSSMDSIVAMQNLHSAIPGIPISRIMAAGFPHSFSAAVQAGGAGAPADNRKNGLNMLPMMLQGITHPHGAAIPQHTIFSIGAMMAQTPTSSSAHASSSSSLSASKAPTTTTPSTSEGTSSSLTRAADSKSTTSSCSSEVKRERSPEEKEAGESVCRVEGSESAAIITSSNRAHLSSAHLGAGSHIAFNPFLIPGMSHGLLYPHMFLPHGGIMALPAMPPGVVDAPPGSPKRRRKRGQEEWERKEEKAATATVEERESTVKAGATFYSASSSSPSIPSTSSPDPGVPLTEELHSQQGDRKDSPLELQKLDSNLQEAATEETAESSEDTQEEAMEKGKQDTEERREVKGEDV